MVMSERTKNYWEASNILTPTFMRRRSKEEQLKEIRTLVEIEEAPVSIVFSQNHQQQTQE